MLSMTEGVSVRDVALVVLGDWDLRAGPLRPKCLLSQSPLNGRRLNKGLEVCDQIAYDLIEVFLASDR